MMRGSVMLLVLGVAAGLFCATVASADEASIAKGKQLVEAKKCAVCHKATSKKGKPMNELTKDKTDEYLKGALLDPKKTIDPKTKMPAYKFSDEEAAAVIDYLKSLAAGEQK
jgi:mono/diheme cytochrome c family protein